MNELEIAYEEIKDPLAINNYKDDLSYYCKLKKFIGILSFSPANEIENLLKSEIEKDYLSMPYELRLIMIRLITLQNPSDKKFIEWALCDTRAFSDGYSKEVRELEKLLEDCKKSM